MKIDPALAATNNLIESPASLPTIAPTPGAASAAGAPAIANQSAVAPSLPPLAPEVARQMQDQADRDTAAYQFNQNGNPNSRQLQNLSQYIGEEGFNSDLGMFLQQDARRLSSGEVLEGLLVVSVDKESAAANAGLMPFKHKMHDALTGAAMAAAMLTPAAPFAMLAMPAIDYFEVGESYDMIVGIDGNRVTSYEDFIERMKNLQPGEIVYLSLVRNGKRKQLSMLVPANVSSALP